MLLFNEPIAWRVNKQDTITTSSIEAELLALSQTAKEAIFINQLLKALMLRLNEPLVIECNNHQILRLMNKESMKLFIKLRHVDIYNHWLRQEHAERQVKFHWTPTKRMPADGLTKALSRQCHEEFMKMISLVDILARIQIEKRMEALQDKIKASKTASKTVFLAHKDIKTGRNYLALQHLQS